MPHVVGKARKPLCANCISGAVLRGNKELLGNDARKSPAVSACINPQATVDIVRIDRLGLGHPSFITQSLLGNKYTTTVSFLEHILTIISRQTEASRGLPDGFVHGLLHIIHEGEVLCGFSLNRPGQWPKNHFFTTEDLRFKGANCPQCIALFMEKFPDHPALAS